VFKFDLILSPQHALKYYGNHFEKHNFEKNTFEVFRRPKKKQDSDKKAQRTRKVVGRVDFVILRDIRCVFELRQ
jgi:hypothetical protein